MFTGLYPRHHQLIMNGMALDPKVATLPGLLSSAGYCAHGVGKQHLQPLLAPADRLMPDSRAFWSQPAAEEWRGPYYGFGTLDLLLGESDTAALAGHYAKWLRQFHPDAIDLLQAPGDDDAPAADLDEIWRSAIPVDLHYNSWITDRAVEFLDGATGEEPFFLFVSYPDPHHPFAPPTDYADRYKPAEMPAPAALDDELEAMPAYYDQLYPTGESFRELYWEAREDMEAGSMITTRDISVESMQTAIAYTYGMIEMIDDGVGRVMRALAENGFADETYVLFTSDHGELLGTHGLLHKGPPPYRQLTEVSMLLQGPDVAEGRTVDALTNHVDLVPTFLDLAGCPVDGRSFDGQSLVPLLQDETQALRRFDFGEYHPTAKPELYNQTVRTAQWRLTIYPKNPEWGELFDLESDPGEHRNLFFDTSAGSVREELERVLASEFPPRDSVDNEWLCKW